MKKVQKDAFQSGFKALGTDVYLQIILNAEEEKIKAKMDVEDVKQIFINLEKIFSRFDPESELNNLNKNLGVWKEASKEMICLAKRALYYYQKSQKLFDPRVIQTLEEIGYRSSFHSPDFPSLADNKFFVSYDKPLEDDLKIKAGKIIFFQRMDLSGIAKGYINDKVVIFLKKKSWQNFLVDSGGDMYLKGQNKQGEKWKIALEGIPSKNLVLAVQDVGVATSGTTRRNWKIGDQKFHHLVDPRRPDCFNFELKSVSVVAKNTERADFLAKILFLMGSQEGQKFAEKFKIAAVFVTENGEIWISPAMQKNVLFKNGKFP